MLDQSRDIFVILCCVNVTAAAAANVHFLAHLEEGRDSKGSTGGKKTAWQIIISS